MPVDHTFDNGRDWLSNRKGQIAYLSCVLCKARHRYAIDNIVARSGDMTFDSLPVATARALGCPRVDRDCAMTARIERVHVDAAAQAMRDMMRLPKGLMRLPDITVGQLSEWQVLSASCRCGHLRLIDRKRLARFPPDTRMYDIAKLLVCRSCGSKKDVWFAFSMMMR